MEFSSYLSHFIFFSKGTGYQTIYSFIELFLDSTQVRLLWKTLLFGDKNLPAFNILSKTKF